jgi:signal transduction histidine kinase
MLHPEDRKAVDESIAEALRTGIYRDVEHRIARPDGTVRWLVGKGALFRSPDGALLKIGGVVDITEQVEAERTEAQKTASLMQAHQAEMVGRLAGGLAHDFNNFLTVINGYTELLLAESGAANPLRDTLERILRAGESAAELTGQLLAYGRKQVMQPVVLDLNATLAALRPLMARLAGENVEVKLILHPDVARVHTDPLQLEQGGELLIGTACAERKTSLVRSQTESAAPRYILLTVTDSGLGMDEETQRRVFEPFFTTKELGKGTGLGMSIVQAIVAQSGGFIEVRSQPGDGTAFTICLPEAADAVAIEATRPETIQVNNNKGNVMVVEDKPEVRDYAARVLTNYGYRVIKADDAVKALLFRM